MRRPGGARGGSRLSQTSRLIGWSFREFFGVPLAIVAAFALLAVLSILADQGHVLHVQGWRAGLAHLIGRKASAQALQAIASGVVTVTSITFSVLLLAVQQTASNLSPVVFNQFIRRKGNQALLGFFVGLAVYSYVVMAAVQDKTPPIIGAFLATILVVVAMLFLLVLIYTTVNQMRPANVLRQIHDRALQAREHETELLRRTRREERSQRPVLATFTTDTNGYVIRISVAELAHALQTVPRAEIRLHVTLGQYVAVGDTIATVRDDDEEDARSLEDAVSRAVLIGRQRDLQQDATTGVDELGNIAWSNGSSAKHSPEVTRQALHELRDLAAQWLQDDREPPSRAEDQERLGVVYMDNDLDRIFEILFSLLLGAEESRQHMTAARVLDVYRELLPVARHRIRERIEQDLALAGHVLDNLPPSRMLQEARTRLERKLTE